MSATADDYVGLTPDAQVEGGGLSDDLDVEIISARWVLYGYPNKAGQDTVTPPAPSLRLEAKAIGNTKLQKPIVEYFSAGSADRLKPSPDGLFLRKVTPTAALVKTTKAGVFCAKAYETDNTLTFGLPKGISQLDGLAVHLQRQPSPEYNNKNIGRAAKGKKDNGMFVITAILKGAGTTAAAGSANGADVDAEATKVVLDIIEAAEGKPVAKAKLTQELFKRLGDHPLRQAITSRAITSEFLEAQAKEGLWKWESSKLSAIPEE